MPPASDPRNLAGPSDTASYRFQVAWEGAPPAKVNFNVQGGSDSVSPSFVFNPANMQSSPISVLMDVRTDDAEEGEYQLTIDAWVADPDTGEECHAEQAAEVVLVVGESRAADLELIKRVGQVEIIPQETEAGDQDVIINTGNDGAVTFVTSGETPDDTTTIDVGSNTAIKEYGHVDHFAKVLENKAKDAELLAMTDDELVKFQHDIMKGKDPTGAEILKNAVKDFLEGYWADLKFDATKKFACLFSADSSIADVCSGKSLFYLWEGDIHIIDRGTTNQLIDRVNSEEFNPNIFMTDNSIVIPAGTALTIGVEQSDTSTTTTVTLFEGSALVVDLASAKTQLVSAGERYSLETSFAGQMPSSTDRMEDVSTDQLVHWWKIQVTDYATGEMLKDAYPYDPVVRTNVFSNQDARVEAWIRFADAVPLEHDVEVIWYWPDGTAVWRHTYEIPGSGSPGFIISSDMSIADNEGNIAEKPGRWKIGAYIDNELVKEIPFYMVKNTFIDDQSAKYAFTVQVSADNEEIRAGLEDGFAAGFSSGFAATGGNADVLPTDVEWMKATVIDNSKGEAKIQPELKLNGQPASSGDPVSLLDNPSIIFIPTIGIDDSFTIPTGFADPFPAQLDFVETTTVDIGGSTVAAYEFSGNRNMAAGGSSSDMTITADYEKHTGMLIDYRISGRIVDPQLGTVGLNFELKATEMSIPTALTISSLSSEISQNQDLKIDGNISPALDGGQVVLTYQKSGASGEQVKRTVPVSNGAFSDSYRMEEDGTYAVSAEYLGSGAYLSSTADAKTLTVTPSGCLIATAAYGSEFAPQVQMLRHIRDGQLMKTSSGSSFMSAFNFVYYSFSPTVANWERENPAFREAVRIAITPLIMTLSILPHVSMDSEAEALGYGIGVILLNAGIYFAAPALAIMALRSKFGKKKQQP